MRIAFLSHLDPHDPHSWSGCLNSMLRSLEKRCPQVVPLGPAGNGWLLLNKVAGRLSRAAGRNVDPTHTILLSKAWGRIFRRKLASVEADLIFAPVASTEIAYLETGLPIVSYSDLTAEFFIGYAARQQGLTAGSIRSIKTIEALALRRAAHLVFASQWAADSARRQYGFPAEKVSVVPIGANTEPLPSRDQIMALRARPIGDECRLLFVGVDWERKGGDIALGAMRELRAQGVNATLTVVGCVPPETAPGMNVIPFLDKAVPDQRRRFEQLLLDSHFMLFPTRREGFGIVCCEANAFGLPLVASDGGGVPVRHGENGILLPASVGEYAGAVRALLSDPARYLGLARGGRAAYDSRLNWDAWAGSMLDIFRAVLNRGAA